MAVFSGYLLAALNSNNQVVATFPHQYMALDSWESTPNQREELKAYRDDNTRDLYRITADGRKSTISFKTVSGLNKSEKEAVQAFFNTAMVDIDQRKVHLKFWNDESCTYQNGYFYLPNIKYPISMISDNDIFYKSVEYSLVEY